MNRRPGFVLLTATILGLCAAGGGLAKPLPASAPEADVVRAAVALAQPEGSFCVQKSIKVAALTETAKRLDEESGELERRLTGEERKRVVDQLASFWIKVQTGPGTSVAPVDPEHAGPLAAAMTRALSKPRKRVLRQVRAEWLPTNAHLVSSPKGCRVAMAISSPVVDGEIAFVDIASWCGPLCGSGRVYAFRRAPDGWKAIGYQQSWVS